MEISRQSRGCWVEIVDDGWKQSIANKYRETLNVNLLHIIILRHVTFELNKRKQVYYDLLEQLNILCAHDGDMQF